MESRAAIANLQVPAAYVQALAELIRSLGADTSDWLAMSGLTMARLEEPDASVSLPLFAQLAFDAVGITREPALGLLLGDRMHAASHGIVGFAVSSAGTPRQAIELLARFVRLRLPLLSVSQQSVDGEVEVQFHEALPLGPMRGPVLEATLLTITRVLDSLSLGSCPIIRVAFPFPAPDHAPLTRTMFGCEVTFDAPVAAMRLLEQHLDLPLRRADPAAFREAAAICQRELDRIGIGERLADRLQRLLAERQNGFPSLAVVARLLQLTPRTLHRRLVAEGSSFQTLLDEVRHRRACEHLRAGGLSIEELAYALGYADPANFRRAFKRWEGVAPSLYRDRLLR
jgi:AraC-like DNA-binding protein